MAIDVKTKHLDSITVAPEFQPAEVSGGVKETLPLVSEGSLSRNEDVLNGGSVNNANLENKRSINELNNAISSICQANNLPLNEIRAMLSLFTRKTEEELLDTIITPQAEINKVVEKIKSAIEAVKEDLGDEGLNLNYIKKYVRLLDGEVPKGWDSVESFREAQKRNSVSLAERLKKMYGIDVKSLSSEKLKETLPIFLKYYFNDYFNELEAQGKTKEEIKNLQLTDFTKLLFNSTPEEYDMFRDAIIYLVNNNRHKGYEAILESFDTQAEKTEFANETPYKKTKEWNTAPDLNNEVPTLDDIKSMTAVVIEYKDAEHIAEYHEASVLDAQGFYNEENLAILEQIKNDPSIIENILTKLANGEELTEEESKILETYTDNQHFKGDNAGQIIGVANNEVIDEQAQIEILELINHDAYKISEKAGEEFYRTVLEEVAEYAKSLPDESKTEFVNLVENALGENYKNIASKNDVPLVAPETTDSSYSKISNSSNVANNITQVENTANTNIDFGYINDKKKPVQTTSVEKLYQDSQNNDAEQTKTEILIRPRNIEDVYKTHGVVNGFNESVKEFGLSASIKYAFEESKNSFVRNNAVKIFKIFNTSIQVNTIKILSGGLSLALNNAKNSTLNRLENITLRSFDATKKAREASDKARNEIS